MQVSLSACMGECRYGSGAGICCLSEDINAFNIHFYEEQLCSLEEAQSYNAYYIMMEIMLGEGLSYQYIASVERADAPLENMIKLPELRAYITDTLKAHGKEIFDNPQQVYTSYRFEPQENEELRFDVMAGSSCFQPLVANYYNGSTELFDRLNGFGAQAVFIAFPYENKEEGDGKKVLDFRYELEDRLAAELLEPEGLGLLLGGAIGTGTCYIDLLLFDESAFMEKIVPFLKDYPNITSIFPTSVRVVTCADCMKRRMTSLRNKMNL